MNNDYEALKISRKIYLNTILSQKQFRNFLPILGYLYYF